MSEPVASPPEVRSLPQLGEGASWILLLGSLLLGGWLVVGVLRQQAWLSGSFGVRFRTLDASGIWPGVHVTVSGYRVGRVERVQLDDDGSVRVDLRIAERYRRLIGRRSEAVRYQEGLIGSSQIALTTDPTPPGQEPARSDLLLPFRQGQHLPELLQEIGQTRLKLDRALEGTARVAERDLPGAIGSFRGTLGSVRTTLGDVSRLSARLERETTQTAAASRRTLRGFERTAPLLDRTGQQALVVSDEAIRLLRLTQPALVGTLEEIRGLTRRINRLLGTLGVEADPGGTSAPAAAPPTDSTSPTMPTLAPPPSAPAPPPTP